MWVVHNELKQRIVQCLRGDPRRKGNMHIVFIKNPWVSITKTHSGLQRSPPNVRPLVRLSLEPVFGVFLWERHVAFVLIFIKPKNAVNSMCHPEERFAQLVNKMKWFINTYLHSQGGVIWAERWPPYLSSGNRPYCPGWIFSIRNHVLYAV